MHAEFGSFLQNMQNCWNSLRCGRVQSPLDKKTTEPLPPESDKKKKKVEKKEVLDFLDNQLSEVINDINKTLSGFADDQPDTSMERSQINSITLENSRTGGSNKCGISPMTPSFVDENETANFIEVCDADDREKQPPKKKNGEQLQVIRMLTLITF